MFETGTAKVHSIRYIRATKQQQLQKRPFYGKQVNSE